MSSLHDGSDATDVTTTAYAEPPPPPTMDDQATRPGYQGRAAGLGSRTAQRRAQLPDRSFDDDDTADDPELTDRLLRGSSASDRSYDRNQMPRVILTLGLTASVVVLVFLGVLLRLPPSTSRSTSRRSPASRGWRSATGSARTGAAEGRPAAAE